MNVCIVAVCPFHGCEATRVSFEVAGQVLELELEGNERFDVHGGSLAILDGAAMFVAIDDVYFVYNEDVPAEKIASGQWVLVWPGDVVHGEKA